MSDAFSDSALMSANGLLYKMPQPLSLAVNRTFKTEFSQRQSYVGGDTVIFDSNSGSAYVGPESAQLSFGIEFGLTAVGDGADTFSFGSGSAANVLQEIRLLSKNGTEIYRSQVANVLAKIMKDQVYGTDGQTMLTGAGHGVAGMVRGTKYQFVIPLSYICGFFRPTVAGMKIPSGLSSGMRLEFITTKFADRHITRTGGTGTGTTFTISDPQLLYSCTELNDPTASMLMKNSAETGLEYTFPSYFATTLAFNQTQLNEQVKKSVSQCTRVFATVYDTSGASSVNTPANDGYKSIDATTHLVDFQFRVGSSYYPQQSVTNKEVAKYISDATFDKNRDIRSNPSSVSAADYNTGGKFMVGHPLETDDRLNLSGIPLNNSSVLELRLGLANAGAVTRELNLFIEYISVARTFINKTSIKI
jgi:hypothetical protein